jgi:hypothetical protein
MRHSAVRPVYGCPLQGRLESKNLTYLKFGGIFACHLN